MSVGRTLIKTREYQIMSPSSLTYKHPSYNGLNVQQALDWIFTILYPNTKGTVATPADLPLTDNELGDYRLVEDDGDGKWAGYRWYKRESDVSPQWWKVHDMDWTTEGVMTAFNNYAQDLYVTKDGRQDTDVDGNPITGTFSGQSIYGGTITDSNLTLHANSGDESFLPEDQTGYIQFHGNTRPTSDNSFDLGTSTERFRDLFITRDITDGTTSINLDELIEAYNHATSLGNPHETTYDDLDDRIGTLTVTGDVSGSVDLSSSGNKTLTLEVANDSHSHTTEFITDFESGVYEALKSSLIDGGGYSWEFDEDTEEIELKLDTDLVPLDEVTDGMMLIGDETEGKWKAVGTDIELIGDVTGSVSYDPSTEKWELETSVESAHLSVIEGIDLTNRTFTSVAGNPTLITNTGHGLATGNVVRFVSDTFTATTEITVIDPDTISIDVETFENGTGYMIPERSQLLFNPVSGDFEVASSGSSLRLGELSGLDEDVLNQYVNKNGRIGGQVIHGGVSASQNLALKSTSHATKGNITTDSNLAPETASGANLGTPELPWNSLVMTGEAKGLRVESVSSLPSATSAQKGRLVDYDGAIWVNNGAQYVRIGSGNVNVFSTSSNYTVTKSNDVVIASGSIVVTLPSPSDFKKRLVILNGGTSDVSISGGSALIDSDNYALIAPKEAIELVNDGTRWHIIHSGHHGESPDLYRYLPKIKPTLNLDFANTKTLDSRITFTRASIATFVNDRGLIEQVASNVPRFDHDPITGECKGLLIEEARTNLLTYSNQFDNSAWTKTRSSVIPNAAIAPDGTMSASKFVIGTEAGSHQMGRSFGYVSGNTYVTSIFAKKGELSVLRINPNDTTFGTDAWAAFDLETGEFAVGTAITAKMEPIIDGWYRCWTIAPVIVAGSSGVTFEVSAESITQPNPTNSGDGTSGIYIWGAQLEEGNFPTSIIPTEATSVTREADQASITGANFSSWYNQSEGSVLTKYNIRHWTNGDPVIFSLDDSTTANRIQMRFSAVPNQFPTVFRLGISQVSGLPILTSFGKENCAVISYKRNDVVNMINGTSAIDSEAEIPNVSKLTIGGFQGSATMPYINGHIARLAYYPRRLTNLELQAVTK